MESLASIVAWPAVVLGLIDLDIDGFLFGPEMAALLTSLFSVFFGGFANAFLGTVFGNGA